MRFARATSWARTVGERSLSGRLYFAHPYADSFTQTARRVFEPGKEIPVGCTERVVESRLTVEAIEIGRDELTVLHAKAGFCLTRYGTRPEGFLSHNKGYRGFAFSPRYPAM